MTNISYAGDKLLDSWLNLTSTLWNTRLVSSLTYNEAHVMGLLLRHSTDENPMTATDLIHRTRLLKSQMNKILTSLESRGYITRTRAEMDKRMIFIRLTKEGMEAYAQEHSRVNAILDQLVSKIGPERALSIAKELGEITEILDGIVPNEK
ncbi:MAG: MarR family transcriptional regulator [Clostridiales bacterium]|nr:MarR family transcriptional regulator [Clostridiales bacterium]